MRRREFLLKAAAAMGLVPLVPKVEASKVTAPPVPKSWQPATVTGYSGQVLILPKARGMLCTGVSYGPYKWTYQVPAAVRGQTVATTSDFDRAVKEELADVEAKVSVVEGIIATV